MNHHIQIALIFWTLLWAFGSFFATCKWIQEGEKKLPFIGATMSFLSLLTALLAVGQYL